MNSPITVTEPDGTEWREVEVSDDRALAIRPEAVQHSVIVGGIAALARMSEDSFDENVKALALVRERIDKVKLALMRDGVDYGPPFEGSKKDTLLKPGAETLLRTFGLADSYTIERHVGDGDATPHLEIVTHCRIHIGDTSGPVIAEGVGSANTHETKHRYRAGSAARTCPDCGAANVIKSKPPRVGWWCGTRDGGCGHSFPEGDKRIEDQQVGKAENADPWDVANTILKMSKKRSQIDGVLTATGASRLFTQDEDAPGGPQDPNRPPPRVPVGTMAPEGPKPPYSLGRQVIEGRLLLNTTGQADGERRTGPEGSVLAFSVEYQESDGQHKVQVAALGALADDIYDACAGSLRSLVRVPVTVEGEFWMTPWNDHDGRAMPPKRSLKLERLTTPDWSLPVPAGVDPLTIDDVIAAVDAG